MAASTPETDQNQDQIIGYLIGKVEGIEKKLDNHNEQSRDFEKDMDARMSRMESKIAVLKLVSAGAKLLFGVVVAVISWKLGDIDKAISSFWNALF